MNEVHVASTVDAPRASAFAYVDTYQNVGEWMYGFKRFEPVGEQTNGLGAVFDAEAKIGATMHARVEVTEWVQDERITMHSIAGIESNFRLTFEDAGDGRTRLESTVQYAFPGGLAGKAMEKVVQPLAHVAARHVESTLKQRIEDAHRAGEI